jgi:hypothetical protein
MPKKVENIISEKKKAIQIETLSKEEELSNPIPNLTDTSVSKKEKDLASRKNILDEFDLLINMINLEIQNSRESSSKTTNVKFLRLVNKNIKSLQLQCVRVLKQKNTTVRQNNNS